MKVNYIKLSLFFFYAHLLIFSNNDFVIKNDFTFLARMRHTLPGTEPQDPEPHKMNCRSTNILLGAKMRDHMCRKNPEIPSLTVSHTHGVRKWRWAKPNTYPGKEKSGGDGNRYEKFLYIKSSHKQCCGSGCFWAYRIRIH
jgi:hypothetical protein